MNASVLNRPQERGAGRQQQTITDQERRRDLLIECDVFATGFCIATFSGLLTFGAIYLYYYINEIPTVTLWYSLIFILLLLGTIAWKFYARFKIKEFHAMQRREYELKRVEQRVNRQIRQNAIELHSNDVQNGSSSNNFCNEASATGSNRILSNRSSTELITDVKQSEVVDGEAGTPEYPTVKYHGDFVEYIFGPKPGKRAV